MANRYFKVTCKCGHGGIKYFIRISFPIIASCGKDAAAIARYIPRVKHDHKDAILDCKEITREEYFELKAINDNDPYLKCECKQDQDLIENFASRLEIETRYLKVEKRNKRETVVYRLKKQTYILKEKWCSSFDEGEWDDELLAY